MWRVSRPAQDRVRHAVMEPRDTDRLPDLQGLGMRADGLIALTNVIGPARQASTACAGHACGCCVGDRCVVAEFRER